MAVYSSALSLYSELKNEWDKSQKNLIKCGDILNQLKLPLTKLIFLPTSCDTNVTTKELNLARNVLEIAVQYSLATKDITAFERYMAQLKCYYFDYKNQIGDSDNKYHLLGLNLLYLLSQNRVSEFHTELELIPQNIIQTNAFIRFPLALEQYLMEGSYNKIFLAKGNIPTESYTVFMDILIETVRDEIAKCLESAYDKISAKEAARRLNIKSEKEVTAFGVKKNWKIESDGFYYFACKAAKPREPLPSIELAEQAIFYAKEMEMIV